MTTAISNLVMFVVGLSIFGFSIRLAYQEPKVHIARHEITYKHIVPELKLPVKTGSAHVKRSESVKHDANVLEEIQIVGNISSTKKAATPKVAKAPTKRDRLKSVSDQTVSDTINNLGLGLFSTKGAREYVPGKSRESWAPNPKYERGPCPNCRS